ncbi:MAG: sulfatase activating formylglycine-generating enzyme [Phycisphaerales bacterium]|jgi:formylglycine-generating enzyme required for sulfatase activity
MKKVLLLLIAIVFVGCSSADEQPAAQARELTVDGYTFKMMPVLSGNGNFLISRTEVPWDVYDSFVQFINSTENQYAVDAVTGPTPAYATVDRGFGRSGYPAISMSAKAADSFCSWLSSKTETTFTIPTIEQWNFANVGGGGAWHKWNADKTTHPIATTEPNTLGVYDMRGNVGEWVSTQEGPRVIGGSFRTPAEELGPKSLLTRDKSWNTTDPQLPRSPWWLADADYVGLRVVINEGYSNE